MCPLGIPFVLPNLSSVTTDSLESGESSRERERDKEEPREDRPWVVSTVVRGPLYFDVRIFINIKIRDVSRDV